MKDSVLEKNQLSERSILRTNIPLRNGKINSVKDELSERSTLRNSNIQKWKYQISEIPKNVSFSNGKIKSEKYQFSEKNGVLRNGKINDYKDQVAENVRIRNGNVFPNLRKTKSQKM